MSKETSPSLAETHPHLAKEWNYKKNEGLTPDKVTKGKRDKVWWTCPEGHDYLAEIKSRANGTGCPYCSGKMVLAGYNDLESKYPELAAQFDEEKNGKKASEVHATSRNKYWWKCEKGHSWQSTPESRTRYSGCPYCSGRYATPETCLGTVNPTLAAELHPTKNEEFNANNLTSQSNEKVWWLCPTCGREWQATVNNRAKGTGCPNCATQKGKR